MINPMRTILITMALTATLGTQAGAEENVLRTKNAVKICTTPSQNWVDFCNGLMQAYSDFAIMSGAACIPVGVTRTQLVKLFTGMTNTAAYKDDHAALVAAVEVFKLVYPCQKND